MAEPFDIGKVIGRVRNDPVPAEFTVPDLTDAVEGWRAWGVPVDCGIIPRLHAVTHGHYVWSPRVISRAECGKRRYAGKDDHVPGEHCTCGFYSAKTLPHLLSMSYHTYDAERHGMFHVVGQVANWGKVVEGTQGWRSEYTYPTKIWLPFEAWYLAEALGNAYGVPVALKNTLNPHHKEA